MLSRLLQSQLLTDLTDALHGPAGAAAYAVCDGAKAALAAALAQKTGRPVLYVAPGDREAARVAEDACQYLPHGAVALRMYDEAMLGNVKAARLLAELQGEMVEQVEIIMFLQVDLVHLQLNTLLYSMI